MTKLFTAIWTKDAETVSKIISDFMFRTISYYDYSEAYYHAFIAGILFMNVFQDFDSFYKIFSKSISLESLICLLRTG